MKVYTDSICLNCKHFEHECNVDIGDGDYICIEFCNSSNIEVRRDFDNTNEIKECKDFITED
ncbi:hypothetical protein [Paenibacillus donghaensis]|uniref:Uncharacterized protein n=1 Tax=Paenibacillus donghaensis TaxID=414771 RepID=A0A2Z2KFA3_9BACL|nr:hypothetical protein [Paenibacillus donghaensis]ASA22645.1 hypothetical protein B9T62_18735 [Paenibacillus donghaensis]